LQIKNTFFVKKLQKNENNFAYICITMNINIIYLIMKQLYFGDNLEIMKMLAAQHPQGFIDLIYIDPPFNSKRNYNILFEDIDLKDTKAQREAFADTWSSVTYHDTLNEIQELDLDLYRFLSALDTIRLSKSAISYLVTMSIRIFYIHKLLKDTGSFYLHCDPNMSHYLKLVCDLIFGSKNFNNELVWKRTFAHGDFKQGARHFGRVHDVILYYPKSDNYLFNAQFTPYSDDYVKKIFKHKDKDGRLYQSVSLTGPGGAAKGNPFYEFLGVSRYWQYSKANMEKLYKEGKIFQTKKGNVPRKKMYLDESPGVLLQDMWSDITALQGAAKERLGYPTQKPEALLKRIIKASSNEGDLVADFFCGCGTTVAVAEKLKRNWIGVDISHLAVKLILKRLIDTHGDAIAKEINVAGFPKDIASAKELAQNTDKHRILFQDWIIEVMIGGISNPKKSGDGGYDGYITYHKIDDTKKKGIGIIEVKSGKINIGTIRAFKDVIINQKADLGILVCFEEQITSGMRLEAAAIGKVENYNINKLQLITVEELLQGAMPKIPGRSDITVFEKARRAIKPVPENDSMF